MTEVEDVRAPLAKFRGKNIPIEFAKWEEDLKEQMRLQWEEEQKNKKGKGFGIFKMGGQQQEQPPVPLFELQRQQLQENFKRTHKAIEEEAAENLKKHKELEAKLKEMKVSVWDIVTKVWTACIYCLLSTHDCFAEACIDNAIFFYAPSSRVALIQQHWQL